MLVYIALCNISVITTTVDAEGAQEEEFGAVMKRGTPLATHYRVLWLSRGDSCQPSWDLWRGAVMEGKGKKQNYKIKARYQ